MIGRRNKDYCCEDPSNIENYDKAIEDKVNVWDCHHRAEILPCGRFSAEDLKKFNLYYNRPASELIFLTHEEHATLHGQHFSPERIRKMSCRKIGNSCHKGHPHSDETKSRISEQKVGLHKFNNGVVVVFRRECPEGFKPGGIRRVK